MLHFYATICHEKFDSINKPSIYWDSTSNFISKCLVIARFEKGGAILDLGCLSFSHSVHPSVRFNSVSTQYLEKYFIESNQILYVYLYWHDLPWDCYSSFFKHLYQSYGPWFTPKLRFRSISWELLDIFSQNFIDAFIITRSSLGLWHVIFRKFVPELWPFI